MTISLPVTCPECGHDLDLHTGSDPGYVKPENRCKFKVGTQRNERLLLITTETTCLCQMKPSHIIGRLGQEAT